MPQLERAEVTLPASNRAQFNWSTWGGLVAILLWSTTVAVTRSLTERLGPTSAGAAVYLVAGCLGFIPWRGWRRPVFSQSTLPPKYLWGCGFLFVSYGVLLYLAIGSAQSREQVLEVGLLNYLWPAFTLVLAVPLLRRRASFGLVPGTVLALAGVFLVLTQGKSLAWSSFVEHWRNRPVGYALAVLAAASWAAYSNLARRWTTPADRGTVRWFVLATGLALLLLRSGTSEYPVWSPQAIGEIAFLGGMTTVAYALWERAMRKGDLILVVACSYLTPLLSTSVTCVYLNVQVTARFWLGCALLVLGSLLSWRSIPEISNSKSQI